MQIGTVKDQQPPGFEPNRSLLLDLHHLETIPDWSPTLDLIAVDLTESRMPDCRIISTAGRAPYGYLQELRVGLEATPRTTIKFDGQQFAGATGFWALSDTKGQNIYFLISFPDETTILSMDNDTSDVQSGFEDCGLDLDNQTVTAVTIGDGRILQITRRSIVVVDVD